jgi:hypothetical protein
MLTDGAVHASPSRLFLGIITVALAPILLLCIAPMLLLLGSFVGLVPHNMGILLVAVPAAGIGFIIGLLGWSAVRDLLLPRPVLSLDDAGILDRRVADAPIAWNDVSAATALTGGGVVLELRSPTVTRLNALRPGTFMFEQPDPGIAHIPVRAMTVPAATLVRAILEHAERHGAVVGHAVTHEKMRRRRWTV